MSDVFGSLIKQRVLKQTAQQADWLIGEGLFTSAVNGKALRSMKAPGTAYSDPVLGDDPQPDHMSRYVNTYNDNGGVHINSGIPNRAFQLAAEALGGYAWEKAGRIWYETLRDSALRPNTGFRRFARLTVSAAARLLRSGQCRTGHRRGILGHGGHSRLTDDGERSVDVSSDRRIYARATGGERRGRILSGARRSSHH